MKSSSAIKEFQERFDRKAAAGVSDMKFFASALSGEASLEDFCAEANEIDKAIERGEVEEFSFGDMPQR